MKKILLQGLPFDIQQVIEEKAATEKLTPTEAVLEILGDAATERAIQHDIELLESWLIEDFDADLPPPCHHCCCMHRSSAGLDLRTR